MRILAIETTDKTGSVAAMAGCNVLAELMLERTQRSAQSLAPAMQRLLEQVGWKPADVQLVAVSIGPGSFTGLRVGVTAAKVFAYAVGAEILGISTLEAIAANCVATQSNNVSVVIDAQRGDVVVQPFARQADSWFEAAGPEQLLNADDWLADLQEQGLGARGEGRGTRDEGPETPSSESEISDFKSPNPQVSKSPNPRISLTGPGLVRLVARLPPGVEALDERFWHPRAALVAQLAFRYHTLGRRDDLWKLVPHYYRRSAAEEKWDARMEQR
jgi:tRNA threonylcarbamoyladenosine biosynthesis protein TsaB